MQFFDAFRNWRDTILHVYNTMTETVCRHMWIDKRYKV